MFLFTMTVIAVVTGLAGFVLSLWFHLSDTSNRLLAMEAAFRLLEKSVEQSIEESKAASRKLTLLVEKHLSEELSAETEKPH